LITISICVLTLLFGALLVYWIVLSRSTATKLMGESYEEDPILGKIKIYYNDDERRGKSLSATVERDGLRYEILTSYLVNPDEPELHRQTIERMRTVVELVAKKYYDYLLEVGTQYEFYNMLRRNCQLTQREFRAEAQLGLASIIGDQVNLHFGVRKTGFVVTINFSGEIKFSGFG